MKTLKAICVSLVLFFVQPTLAERAWPSLADAKKWGFIDRSGKFAIAPKYDLAETVDGEFAETLSSDGQGGEIRHFFSLQGQELQTPEQLKVYQKLEPKRSKALYGFANLQGTFLILPIFLEANPFAEGLAAVSCKNQAGEVRWGYIDSSGTFRIPAKFDSANSFKNGYAVVQVKNKFGLIDHAGNFVTGVAYDDLLGVSEKMAAFKRKDRWGFVNIEGIEVIPANFERAGYYSEGLAPTKSAGKWGFIDTTGKMVIPSTFDLAHSFSQGHAAVCVDAHKHKWTFIDRKGTRTTQDYFYSAEDYSEGLAAVRMSELSGAHSGYIDLNGKIAIPTSFGACGRFFHGLAPARRPSIFDVTNQLRLGASD